MEDFSPKSCKNPAFSALWLTGVIAVSPGKGQIAGRTCKAIAAPLAGAICWAHGVIRVGSMG
jgi:hypothetical protein